MGPPVFSPGSEAIEETTALIRQSAIRQIECAQTIMDGAILAAEQVQDKRLELLEQGPEVSGFDVFIDFALTFILESPLAGKIFQTITTKMLLPRVRANQVAQAKALRVLALKPGARLPGGFLAVPERIVASQLAKRVKDLHKFERLLIETGSEEGPYPYMVAFAKAMKQAGEKERRPAPLLEPSDTPGVAILDLAQQHLSKERLAIQIEHSMFELWVRTGQMSVEEARNTVQRESIEASGKLFSLAEIKDRFKRHFELLIWTFLLYERPLTGKAITTPRQTFTLTGYVQPSLIAYWMKRFIDPDTERPFSETPALRRPDGKPPLDRSINALGTHMWGVAEKGVEKNVALLSAGPLVPK
ncbi:MAG TPA: hypothetical protein VNJ06_00120 [Gemmatimonadales bacterium]|nr:hypothetical protein [Gemmatimonadales bacterium]